MTATTSAAALPRRPLLAAAALVAFVGVAAATLGLGQGSLAYAASGATAGPAAIADDATPYDLTYATVGPCKVGAECVATVTINAKGEYHVNESYPFKLTAAGEGLEFHGAGGNVFSGADFARVGAKTGILTVKFKPAAKGKATVSGPYKICICTEKVCQPTVVNVSFDVDVKA